MNIINKNRQEKGVAGISLLIVVIVIISVIILAGFKWETDRAVTGTVGKVAQEQLEASVSIEGKYWKIDDSIYDKIKEELKAQGIDVFSLGFRNKDYLQKIVKAELVSNYPNLGEEVDPNDKNKFQGIVNFIRRDADGTTDGQIMQYMPEDEFNSYISAGDYESIKNMYTIDFSTNSTTGSTGADASGTYNGKNINYYADFAALSETPEELGLTVSKSYQNARTTTYGPEGFANGGYEGLTCVPGIDLVEGMKIAAMPMHKDAININDVQIGDWIYVENLGYFIVSDLGDKNGNFRNENWFDLFHIDGESGFVYQDYSNIKVIKQSEVENFVNSGYVKNSTQTSVTQNNTDMQKTITNTPEIKKSSMQIVVATKSEIDGVVSISKQKIDYKSQVSNYSVPMEFIVAHLQITNSVDYAIAIADMVINNSKIDYLIQDCYSERITNSKYEYYKEFYKKEGDNYVFDRKEGKFTEDTKTSTVKNWTIVSYIREADIWIANVTNEYTKKTSGPDTAVQSKNTLGDVTISDTEKHIDRITYDEVTTSSITYNKSVSSGNPSVNGSIGSGTAVAGDGYASEYTKGGSTFREYKQDQGSYEYNGYWGGQICYKGCGPTAIAIATSGYIDGYDPGDIAISMDANYGYTGPGSLSSQLTSMGLNNTLISSPSDKYHMLDQLKQGKTIVVSVNNNEGALFTKASHIMAVLDADNNDNVYVSNPNSARKTGWVSLDTLWNCTTYYIVIEESLKPVNSEEQTSANTNSENTSSNEANLEENKVNTSNVENKTSNSSTTNATIKSNEEKFLGLWKNSVGYYVPYYNEDGSINEDAKYKPDGKVVRYADGTSPVSIIFSSEDWFFSLLEANERTQNHLQIMKYLMYVYSGTDYGVTELDLSIFDTKEFISVNGGASGGGALEGIEREIFSFLTSKGMTAEGAAAIMGNISQESSFNPQAVNSVGASGLCQWEGERKNGLISYANSKGKDWTDVQTQLEFLWLEIDPSADKTYANQQINATDFDALMNATDIEEATLLVRKKFERCGEADANDAYRFAEAKRCYEQAQQGGGGTNGTTNVEGTDCATYTSSSGKTYIEYKQDVGSWASLAYGNKSIAAQGCSIVSIAIATSGYGYNYTPAKWSGPICSIYGETKALLPGSTLTYTTGSSCGSPNFQEKHKTDIQNHLNTGNAVIFHVYGSGRGYSSEYTSNQHWMTLTDINGEQVYVSNPNSKTPNGWNDISSALQSLCCYIKVSK